MLWRPFSHPVNNANRSKINGKSERHKEGDPCDEQKRPHRQSAEAVKGKQADRYTVSTKEEQGIGKQDGEKRAALQTKQSKDQSEDKKERSACGLEEKRRVKTA